MEQRFCNNCGAKLVTGARFCVECGASQGGRAETGARLPYERYAPALLLGIIVVVGGAVILLGSRSAPPPPSIPGRRGAAEGPAAPSSGGLPEGHPPITVPEAVRKELEARVEALKQKPDDLAAWIETGRMQYEAAHLEPAYLDDATTTFTHILERDPNNKEALRTLGNIAYDLKQPAQAIEYYERFLKLEPQDSEVRTDLGTMYLGTEQPAKAIEVYEQVLALDPTFFQAQFNLAVAHREAGSHDKELAALEKARDLAKDEDARRQVEQIIARAKSRPSSEAAKGRRATGTGLSADVEAIFAQHQMLGPKLDHVDWPDSRTAKVVLREFPMDNMPPDMREVFADHIRTSLQTIKTRYAVTNTLRVDLVDAASGRVMETVTQ